MVPPASHRVSRVLRYSGSSLLLSDFGYGALTLCRRPSHAVLLTYRRITLYATPKILLPSVWPLPRSLATTGGISVDVFSSPYLDVSVQAVPRVRLFDSTHATQVLPVWVAPFGNLRITGYLLLPEAYRSLSRPSSAPDAKAFPLRSFQLDLRRRKVRSASFPRPAFRLPAQTSPAPLLRRFSLQTLRWFEG